MSEFYLNVSGSEWAAALRALSATVQRAKGMEHVDGILLNVTSQSDRVRLSATDRLVTVTTVVDAEIEGKCPLRALLPPLVLSLADEEVERVYLCVADGMVAIEIGTATYHLPIGDGGDFPDVRVPPTPARGVAVIPRLYGPLAAVLPAAARDIARAALCSIKIEYEAEGAIRFTGLDGFRAHTTVVTDTEWGHPPDGGWLAPVELCEVVLGLSKGGAQRVFEVGDVLYFAIGDVVAYAARVDPAGYPEWHGSIPDDTTHTARCAVSAGALIDALRAVKLVATEAIPVAGLRVRGGEKGVEVFLDDPSGRAMVTHVPYMDVEAYGDADVYVEVGFLIDAMQAVGAVGDGAPALTVYAPAEDRVAPLVVDADPFYALLATRSGPQSEE